MQDIDSLCESLSYMSASGIREVRKAYKFAHAAHGKQVRRSGEPYISHPTKVAVILAKLQPDKETILAALLHDVIEDTKITAKKIESEFGAEVRQIVDGVSKLMHFKSDNYRQAAAENFQKMALAMANDIRVILVKLADRYHNMQTIHHLSPTKQKRIALETLHIYAPIANRLGMDGFYRDLQDMSFKVIYPMRFKMIDKAVASARKKNRDYIEEIKQTFVRMLEQSGIKGKVEGRRKHLAGIYFKMSGGINNIGDLDSGIHYKGKRMSFGNIMDIHGFRVITGTVDNCYLLLGHVHRVFRPYPNRFKDYIANPKVNGYQSLHTTVMGTRGYPIEVQIRTQEMHRVAQTGIASHWLYKAKQSGNFSSAEHLYFGWRKSLIEMQNESGNSQEFLDNVKLDLFPNDVYVFSPRGDIFSLPKGATPVDFAYAVHTDIGNSCVGSEIDGEAVPLSTQLSNGQTVRIITDKSSKPSPDWRSFVVTAKALSAMGYYFRHLRQSEAVKLGKALIDNALASHGTSLVRLRNEEVDEYLQEGGYATLDDLLERVGTGKLYPVAIASQLLKTIRQQKHLEPLIVGNDNSSILSFGRCCRPVKGDAIAALMRTDMGIVIHRISCSNIKKQRKIPHNFMPAGWQEEAKITLPVNLKLELTNNRELVGSIADTIASLGFSIKSMEIVDSDVNIQVIHFVVLVEHRYHLSRLLRRLRKLADVKHVARI